MKFFICKNQKFRQMLLSEKFNDVVSVGVDHQGKQ